MSAIGIFLCVVGMLFVLFIGRVFWLTRPYRGGMLRPRKRSPYANWGLIFRDMGVNVSPNALQAIVRAGGLNQPKTQRLALLRFGKDLPAGVYTFFELQQKLALLGYSRCPQATAVFLMDEIHHRVDRTFTVFSNPMLIKPEDSDEPVYGYLFLRVIVEAYVGEIYAGEIETTPGLEFRPELMPFKEGEILVVGRY